MELRFDQQQPLDLNISLMMGQAFRWHRKGEWFSGVVQGNFINIRRISDGVLEVQGGPSPDACIAELLRSYLRLDEDIEAIYTDISKRDRKIAELVRKYRGLRILRQEPWECLVSYICSGNNSVAQISQSVEKLAEKFGDRISLGRETRYSFPTPDRIIEAGVGELEDLRLGLSRAMNIHWAARRRLEGDLDFDALKQMPYQEARNRLMERESSSRKAANGIGDKIADCVALFSLDKLEAFPVDRHIGRALVRHCFPDLQDGELRKLHRRGQERFGPYAGYAGQFLFYDIRQRK